MQLQYSKRRMTPLHWFHLPRIKWVQQLIITCINKPFNTTINLLVLRVSHLLIMIMIINHKESLSTISNTHISSSYLIKISICKVQIFKHKHKHQYHTHNRMSISKYRIMPKPLHFSIINSKNKRDKLRGWTSHRNSTRIVDQSNKKNIIEENIWRS